MIALTAAAANNAVALCRSCKFLKMSEQFSSIPYSSFTDDNSYLIADGLRCCHDWHCTTEAVESLAWLPTFLDWLLH